MDECIPKTHGLLFILQITKAYNYIIYFLILNTDTQYHISRPRVYRAGHDIVCQDIYFVFYLLLLCADLTLYSNCNIFNKPVICNIVQVPH